MLRVLLVTVIVVPALVVSPLGAHRTYAATSCAGAWWDAAGDEFALLETQSTLVNPATQEYALSGAYGDLLIHLSPPAQDVVCGLSCCSPGLPPLSPARAERQLRRARVAGIRPSGMFVRR